MAILAEKDAPAMIEALAPALEAVVCTELPVDAVRRRSWSAARLADLCRGAGVEARAEPDPRSAIELGRRLAESAGAPLVVAGSHYLLASARAALCDH